MVLGVDKKAGDVAPEDLGNNVSFNGLDQNQDLFFYSNRVPDAFQDRKLVEDHMGYLAIR